MKIFICKGTPIRVGGLNHGIAVHTDAFLAQDFEGRECRVTLELLPDKTAGEVAFDAYPRPDEWKDLDPIQRDAWERTAKAVLEWDAERRRKAVKEM